LLPPSYSFFFRCTNCCSHFATIEFTCPCSCASTEIHNTKLWLNLKNTRIRFECYFIKRNFRCCHLNYFNEFIFVCLCCYFFASHVPVPALKPTTLCFNWICIANKYMRFKGNSIKYGLGCARLICFEQFCLYPSVPF
jgi:hypothetical protein